MTKTTTGSGLRTEIALLRGINIGQHQRVSMPALRVLFEALDAEDVQTYVQSGNVVFKTRIPEAELGSTITHRIRDDLGLGVVVVLRTPAALRKVIKANPFLKTGADVAKLHVTFLADSPDGARVRGLPDASGGPDEFEVRGREVYVHCPGGYGTTKWNNMFFEKKLGVPATTRNWKTVTALAALAGT
jgi:uncharacterized protein (DUF1697 family)